VARLSEDMLPGVVVLQVLLVRADQQVRWIAAAKAYPEGITSTS
jgi:hypothetical protein